MSGYPKTKYHIHGGGSITVYSEEQEKLLGPVWVDHVAYHEPPAKAANASKDEQKARKNEGA